MKFHSHANQTHFHMNGSAPGLALKERLRQLGNPSLLLNDQTFSLPDQLATPSSNIFIKTSVEGTSFGQLFCEKKV